MASPDIYAIFDDAIYVTVRWGSVFSLAKFPETAEWRGVVQKNLGPSFVDVALCSAIRALRDSGRTAADVLKAPRAPDLAGASAIFDALARGWVADDMMFNLSPTARRAMLASDLDRYAWGANAEALAHLITAVIHIACAGMARTR